MARLCEVCRRPLPDDARKAQRFCSGTCRQRAHRTRPPAAAVAEVVAIHDQAVDAREAAASVLTLERATIAALAAANRLATPQGVRALLLARRMDQPGFTDTGSMLASLSKAHGEALDAALAGAPRADDGVDELKDRRDRRRTGS